MPPSHTKEKSKSKTPTTTIKIAAKEASQRNSAGAADPGPGDPSAAPSEAPQLVDLPDPPTPSELVVKSVTGKKSTDASGPAATSANTATAAAANTTNAGSDSLKPGSGYKSTTGASKSKSKLEGSVAGPAASNPSIGSSVAREPTSSKPLTGPTNNSEASDHHDTGPRSAGKGAPSQSGTPESPNTVSKAMQADGGAVHDEVEEGEGEVEQPQTPGSASPAAPASPSSFATGTTASPSGGLLGSSQTDSPAARTGASSPQNSTSAYASSAGSRATSPTSSAASSSKKAKSSKKGSLSLIPGSTDDAKSSGIKSNDKDGKKVTKFRYHKRITVRTSGKTSPTAIMDKVNQKNHNAGITPSTIEDMDPQELMKRAGIKGTNKTHWRIRLRQTKRLTKNGKTVTQTKVAYRDSEGNKRVKSSSSPFCKTCGKKLEECKCETSSQNSQK